MPIKMINMGDSSAGKTGALISLARAGYKLRIIDLDNGMEVIKDVVTSASELKDTRLNIRWKTITEPMMIIGGNFRPKSATVWNRAVEMLSNWKGDKTFAPDGTVIDAPDVLGPVEKWHADSVLVIDTLSTLGTAAMNFYLMGNGSLGEKRTSFQAMRDIGAAQEMLDKVFQFTFDDGLKCNVIFNAHTLTGQMDGSNIPPDYEGIKYVFPAAIGRAISIGKTSMSRYFNHVLYTVREGNESRIYTKDRPGVQIKTGAPTKVQSSYSAKDGLEKYFLAVNGPVPKAPPLVAAAAKPPIQPVAATPEVVASAVASAGMQGKI